MIEATGLTKVFGISRKQATKALDSTHGRHDSITAAGGVLAVDDVSFTIETGELFVIMGLSGSGKSTLIRMVNRLMEPTAGTVVIDGDDVMKMSDKALRSLRNRRVNMVFQHFALFPHRSVRDNVAYGLKTRGVAARERTAKANTALEQVGLGHRGDAYPGELSGGQQQRVGLARALATDADVLLMDEPFSALDPLIRRDMQNLLLDLQKEFQKTILFVTHDLNEAMRIGDRIMVMKDGRSVQLGTGPEIIAEPATDYVREFVSDVDRTRVITAAALMREPIVLASVDEAPRQALRKLEGVEASGLYVLDAERHVLGVAKDEALAHAVGNGKDLRSVLVNDYETVVEDTPIVDFAHLCGNHPVPLGVLDLEGRLCGVVPRAAILSAISGNNGQEHAHNDAAPAGESTPETAEAGEKVTGNA